MQISPTHIDLASPEVTTRLARRFARIVRPGDTLLLEGGIGAGKTHFARALIQDLLITPEDVPSPTFTLVQTYDTQKGSIWHADLYRVRSADDASELGLQEAIGSEICLIEWPDRLGDLAPKDALTLRFDAGNSDAERSVEISWRAEGWGERMKDIIRD